MWLSIIDQAFERLYASDKPPPRCPEDLNLAQYAYFLFTKKCMVRSNTHDAANLLEYALAMPNGGRVRKFLGIATTGLLEMFPV